MVNLSYLPFVKLRIDNPPIEKAEVEVEDGRIFLGYVTGIYEEGDEKILRMGSSLDYTNGTPRVYNMLQAPIHLEKIVRYDAQKI